MHTILTHERVFTHPLQLEREVMGKGARGADESFDTTFGVFVVIENRETSIPRI